MMDTADNSCVNCGQLYDTIELLKKQNLLLNDKQLVCSQQLLAYNQIHALSIKCLHVLESIVDKLSDGQLFSDNLKDCDEQEDEDQIDGNDTSNDKKVDDNEDNEDIVPESDVRLSDNTRDVTVNDITEFEAIPDPGFDNRDNDNSNGNDKSEEPVLTSVSVDLKEPSFSDLKVKYHDIHRELNCWIKQLEEVNSIKSYPRFPCVKYVDTPTVRRSNRMSLPLAPVFTSVSIKTEKDLFTKLLTPEEVTQLASGRSIEKQKLRHSCPYPKCGFRSYGSESLRNHVKEMHTKSKITTTATTSSDNSSQRTTKSLSCPHPSCPYVTTIGHLQNNLQKHLKRVHRSSKGLRTDSNANKFITVGRCQYTGCNFRTRYRTSMKRHMNVHKGQGSRQVTNQTTDNKVSVSAVTNIISNQSKNCDTSLAKKPLVKQTFRLHCTKCKFITRGGLNDLRKHMIIHNRDLAFKCDKCDASFGRSHHLTDHKRSSHGEIIPFSKPVKRVNSSDKWKKTCTVCLKEFRWPSDLRRHMRSHESESLKSTEEFVESPKVEVKEETERPEILPDNELHDCPHNDCSFSTDDMHAFQKHVVTHILNKHNQKSDEKIVIKKSTTDDEDVIHNNSMNGIEVDVKSSKYEDYERKTRSKSCSSSGGNNSVSLGLNSITHRLMKSLFKCDAKDCDFSSDNAEDWIKHNDWHKGHEKSRFKCVHCRKNYAKLSILRAHQRQRKHFSYDCSVCDEMFRTPTLLEIHMSSAHGSHTTTVKKLKAVSLLKPKIPSENLMLGTELINMMSSKSTVSSSNGMTISCAYVLCNKRFNLRAMMTLHFNKCHQQVTDNHLINISKELRRCEDCGTLLIASSLRRHMQNVHRNSTRSNVSVEDINPEIFNGQQNNGYHCQRNGCGKWFESALELREHLNLEHNRNTEAEPEHMVYDEDNSFRCDICDINMTTEEELDIHHKYVHFNDSEDQQNNDYLYSNQWLPNETVQEITEQPIESNGLVADQPFETIIADNNDNDFVIVKQIKNEILLD